MPFSHIIRSRERAKYDTVELSKNTDGKRSNKMAGLDDQTLANSGGIINPLFDGLTYTRGGGGVLPYVVSLDRVPKFYQLK